MMKSEIFKKVPVEILIYLYHSSEPQSVSKIMRTIGASTSVAQRTPHLLERVGLVKTKRKGAKLYVSLTNKGKEVAKLFETILFV